MIYHQGGLYSFAKLHNKEKMSIDKLQYFGNKLQKKWKIISHLFMPLDIIQNVVYSYDEITIITYEQIILFSRICIIITKSNYFNQQNIKIGKVFVRVNRKKLERYL